MKPVMEAVVQSIPVYNVTTLSDAPLGAVVGRELVVVGFEEVQPE